MNAPIDMYQKAASTHRLLNKVWAGVFYFSLQVLSQDDTPLLYSLVFGEGVVNDATSVVLFRAVQKLTFDDFTGLEVLQMTGSFLYLFFSSTVLGIMVSLLLQLLWMLFVQIDLPI